MSDEVTRCFVELPIPAAAHLALVATKHGASLAEYLGYLVLKQAYGYANPLVLAYELRPESGQ